MYGGKSGLYAGISNISRRSMTWHSVGPKLGCMGTGSVVQWDDAVLPAVSLSRRLLILVCPTVCIDCRYVIWSLKRGRGLPSVVLWACLDGFTAWCATLTFAVTHQVFAQSPYCPSAASQFIHRVRRVAVPSALAERRQERVSDVGLRASFN